MKWVQIQPEASREGTSWTEWRVRWTRGEVISCGLQGISLITGKKSRLLVRRYPQLPLRPVNVTAICLAGMRLCVSVDLQRKDASPCSFFFSRPFIKEHFTCRPAACPLGFLVINKHVYLYDKSKKKRDSVSRLTWTCAVRLV